MHFGMLCVLSGSIVVDSVCVCFCVLTPYGSFVNVGKVCGFNMSHGDRLGLKCPLSEGVQSLLKNGRFAFLK